MSDVKLNIFLQLEATSDKKTRTKVKNSLGSFDL